MKLLAVILVCIAVAYAAPQRQDRGRGSYSFDDVQLLRYENEPNYGPGLYRFNYETSDGAGREEQSEVRNQGRDDEYLAVRGVYTWIAPDTNRRYTVKYVADENGYQPEVEEGPGDISPLAASLIG